MSEIQNTGQFSKVIVTKVGKEMIAKSQNGQTLTFTRVALGDGLIGQDEDPVNFTALKSERLSANIAKYTDKGNGQFELQFRVSNQEVETGFWHREIGVMAKIDEGPEQLYAYTTAGNQASFLYDKTTPVEERIVNIAFVIGNAQNVQVVVNSSVIYVTLDDMKEAITAHNTNADSHAEAFNKHDNNANTHELAFNKHNADINAHSNLFNKKLDKAGGTLTGDLNVSGHNITATKFIGNLQGKADSAANADLAAKATTAENANNANNSSVANKLGTSTVGSATKPVYINNGVASAVSVDLSTLAPKASPGLTGTPTAPTANVDTNNTQIATCGFVRNAIAKFAPMLDTMKKIYPVGSIYISTVSTNPATLFGFGTWEAMPAGRVLLAQGKSDWGTTYNAGSTGGEATHQLTVGELPPHTHTASTNTTGEHTHIYKYTNGFASPSNSGSLTRQEWLRPVENIDTSIAGNHSHTVIINNTGSGNAHNNLQPYVSCYIYKRVS